MILGKVLLSYSLPAADPHAGGTPPQGTRLELTVLIVAILKEAMLTYPGNIDFETGVSNAFTPLKYAIDRGIYEQFMLQPLEEPWPSSC